MSVSVSKPLPAAERLSAATTEARLTAVPVLDVPPKNDSARPAEATAAADPASPPARTSWSVVLGLWFWRMRLAFGSSSISGTLHGVAVVALAVMAATSPSDRRPPPHRLEVTVETSAAKQEILPKLLPQMKPQVAESAVSRATATAHGEGSDGSGGGRGGGSVGGLQLAGLNPGKLNVASGGTGFGTDDAFGRHMLGDIGELAEPSATFFGVKADGRKFAFVVDTSGSMARNTRFLRCRQELIRSLASMTYGQQFFVVFFNHTIYPMPEHKLVDARPAQIKKTAEWAVGAVPAGGTEPWPGLQLALRLKPDAIYLLTDGQFNPEVVEKVINAQPESKKIPIHTIAFESPEGAQLLEMISRVTGGQHQFVP